MSNAPLLFVHVPKTAGTSFIVSLEKQFGANNLGYDYGLKSPKTSAYAQENIYENHDSAAFYQGLKEAGTKVFCGHFPVEKYVKEFGPENTMIILRDPVQRLVSEYLHSTRHHGVTKEFPEYYREDYYINRQADFAAGIPLADYGFIGITEHYLESIALVNHVFGMELKVEKVGMHRPTVESSYDLDPELDEEIRILYARDIQLYEAGVEIFKSRLETA